MFRKPPSIYILSFMFLISPLAIILFNASVSMIPLAGYGNIFRRLNGMDWLILCLYVLTAVSIFMIKKWGWWTIIASASLMFAYNLYTYFINPFASILVLLLMNLALFSVALFFFRKEIIAPYFYPRLRWWEQDERYRWKLGISFSDSQQTARLMDISLGGAYVTADFDLNPQSEHAIALVHGNEEIFLYCRIMRIDKLDRDKGYGLMFIRVAEHEKLALARFVSRLRGRDEASEQAQHEMRHDMRHYVDIRFTLSNSIGREEVDLADLSMSGCALITSLEIQEKADFSFMCMEQECSLTLIPVWRRCEEEKYHYGFKFSSLSGYEKRRLKRLISHLKELGAGKKKLDKESWRHSLEDGIDQTPYRMVGKIVSKLDRKTSRTGH